MARLPTPGGDDGNWGEILNEFLEVELDTDGTLKRADEIAQSAQDAAQNYTDTEIGTHASATTNVHGAPVGAKIAVMHGGGRNIYVQESAPTAEFDGDLWVDTSGE